MCAPIDGCERERSTTVEAHDHPREDSAARISSSRRPLHIANMRVPRVHSAGSDLADCGMPGSLSRRRCPSLLMVAATVELARRSVSRNTSTYSTEKEPDNPVTQLVNRRFLGQGSGLPSDVVRHPSGKWLHLNAMRARFRMHFTNACDTSFAQIRGEPHDGRPQTTMHVRDAAIDQAGDKRRALGLIRSRGHISKGRCDRAPTTAPTSPETR